MAKTMLKKWLIGGLDQWIMIKEDQAKKTKPVLLFLHGGPGSAQMSYIDSFHKELDQDFTVVHWDQRGAGLSYKKDIPESSMTIGQFVEDTIELTEKLLSYNDQTKIYIAGYSWGSLIAIQAVHKRPDLYHAYYGISQVVDVLKEDIVSYELLLKKYQGKHFITRCLRLLTPPPWKRTSAHALFSLYKEFAKVGLTHRWKPLFQMLYAFLVSKHYQLKDKWKFLMGQKYSQDLLWDELMNESIQYRVSSILIPCYFIIGEHDMITPAAVSKPYVDQLTAPIKEWFTFKESAHSPHIEEPEEFIRIVRKTATHHLQGKLDL
ncbi:MULTISPECIES: alpha/beta fold hydrolase [Bacillus]|uniref:alpha/beta fold hydrolase n=1 Tax=Bacillus TaxID=1386 RepID=UPI0007630B10|nr:MULTISPECIES: alpha/beta hydrolase [Bacillus]AMB88496.1 alpha/beta hydrolase [Bacillus altitudinis]ANT55292.1 alpha/beta hydrolase [Bacillus pumilus]MCA0118375.1 alpha/beta hydrolase [Bacillus sp. RSS_NA_20]QII23146.1 alpha/beta hydrolase [Bacillus altitudinis]